jgi:phosphate transport system protein
MSQALEGHTVERYDGELNTLHLKVTEMGALVLTQVNRVIQALQQKNTAMAHDVLETEHEIDHLELAVDDQVVAMIAKRGPVARDLRVIMSISKATTDLERIGDEAARMANLVLGLYDKESSQPSGNLMRDVNTIGRIARDMLKEALESFDTLDAERARALVCTENELDMEFQSSLRRLATFMLEDARNVGHTIHIVLMIKALERIGDHARNIAEYIVYMVLGEDIRHHVGAFCQTGDSSGNQQSGGATP